MVCYAGKHRHAVDPGVDAGFAQPSQSSEAGLRCGCARLDSTGDVAVERDEREMNGQRRSGGDSGQDVDITRYQRTLGDDHDLESPVLGQDLEQPASNAKSPLRRLVRVGRRSDYNRLSAA